MATGGTHRARSRARSRGHWWGPWWGVLLLLLGTGVGSSAGFWQLGRAAEKRELEAQFADGSKATALTRLVADDELAALRYRTLTLDGSYDADHQVLLDNISYRGRPGYQVLTPLVTPRGAVLVNRGWVPADGNRAVLPDIRVSAAERTVTGRIERLPRPAISLEEDVLPAGSPWPRRLLFPTSARISAQTGKLLRDYQVLLDADDPDGFVRDWRPGGIGPERHLGYAVQWFGLALTVIVIYGVLVLRSREKSP